MKRRNLLGMIAMLPLLPGTFAAASGATKVEG
jgi:hypothetical protein